jgi:hypothetical protein
MSLFPFLMWLGVITSGVLLSLLWGLGELRRGTLVVLTGCLLLAGHFQLFAGSPTMAVAGLVAQTMLAIYLLVRWRLSFVAPA